jgi:SAM-dependent methyltransferase
MTPDTQWMQERWESLARRNAEFFIWTDVARGDDFAASGERDAGRIMTLVGSRLTSRGRALEFGCGVGRLTIPIARHFDEVIGVDIAPTMLAKLTQNSLDAGASNVKAFHVDDRWENIGAVDLAYSHIVFQHVEDWNHISSYFRRIASCVREGGVFYAQFDTRPSTLSYRVRNVLPEFVLPSNWIRGVRRIRRNAGAIERLARECGFRQEHVSGVGTPDTVMIFRR